MNLVITYAYNFQDIDGLNDLSPGETRQLFAEYVTYVCRCALFNPIARFERRNASQHVSASSGRVRDSAIFLRIG